MPPSTKNSNPGMAEIQPDREEKRDLSGEPNKGKNLVVSCRYQNLRGAGFFGKGSKGVRSGKKVTS